MVYYGCSGGNVFPGAGRSSEVERSLMVRWVVGSILHGVDPLSYFSFQPVLHDWCNKGCDMCYPVCGMVHIKEPLLLIDKSRAFAHGAMGRRIDPSWGGPIELFLVPASAPRLVYQRLWYVLSCLWDGAYKRTLAANRKE